MCKKFHLSVCLWEQPEGTAHRGTRPCFTCLESSLGRNSFRPSIPETLKVPGQKASLKQTDDQSLTGKAARALCLCCRSRKGVQAGMGPSGHHKLGDTLDVYLPQGSRGWDFPELGLAGIFPEPLCCVSLRVCEKGHWPHSSFPSVTPLPCDLIAS
jgi:hypothetical protein